MTQQDMRESLLEGLAEELDTMGMTAIGDVVMGEWKYSIPDTAIDKAVAEAYTSLMQAMKKISRLAVRMDFLEKGEM